MAYTSHGHHIPGTVDNHQRPETIARCGGPGLCKVCSKQAGMYTHPSNTTLHGKKEPMHTSKFARKSFQVEGVQVTAENINEVAEWCGGDIRYRRNSKSPEDMYIRVNVTRPLNERQKRAYLGNWVLKSDRGWKVFTENAFHASFDEVKEGADAPYLAN